MRVVAISTCDCGTEKCPHSQSVIVCLYAEDETDKEIITRITEDLEASAIDLPEKLILAFWHKVEEERSIVESAKQLLPHLYR